MDWQRAAARARRRSTWTRRAATALSAVAAAGAGVAVGAGVEEDTAKGPAGTVEVIGALRGEAGVVGVTVRRDGARREIALVSNRVRSVPRRFFYELWLITGRDTELEPRRVPVGTFRPEAGGRVDVSFTTGVDPVRYRGLVVSAEPEDGDAEPSGRDVLRLRFAR